MLIQALIAKASMKCSINIGILIELSWFKQPQHHVVCIGPHQHGSTTKLLSIVSANHLWQAAATTFSEYLLGHRLLQQRLCQYLLQARIFLFRAFSCLTTDAVMPPNLLHQRYS